MAPAKSLRELLQAVRPPWKKKDLEAIEARLSRLGIFSVQELLVAVRGRTLGEMLQRSGKPLPPPALEALCQVAEAYADGTLTEWPEKTKQAFPRMHGLSHIRRSPRWTFSQSSDFERRFAPPGPGQYNLEGEQIDAMSRYQKGPIFSFGLSGREPVGKTKIPGPGAYELAQEAGTTTSKWTMTPRRRQRDLDLSDLPGPGEYDLEATPRPPRGPTAGQRSDQGKKQLSPGPGDCSQGDFIASKTPSWRFGSSNRPNGAGDLATPGPGAYMLASKVGDSPGVTLKGRHAAGRPSPMPGPGAHGGHYSSFG